MTNYFPGTRVMVFDHRLFEDDVSTPLSHTIRPATVKRWYGKISDRYGTYPNLIDVKFDHRPDDVSRGHFADHVEVV